MEVSKRIFEAKKRREESRQSMRPSASATFMKKLRREKRLESILDEQTKNKRQMQTRQASQTKRLEDAKKQNRAVMVLFRRQKFQEDIKKKKKNN